MFHYFRKIGSQLHAHRRKSGDSPTRTDNTAATSDANSPAVERLRSYASKGKGRGDAEERSSIEGRGRQERPSAQPDRGEAVRLCGQRPVYCLYLYPLLIAAHILKPQPLPVSSSQHIRQVKQDEPCPSHGALPGKSA